MPPKPAVEEMDESALRAEVVKLRGEVAELESQKDTYGLHWEDKPEQVEEDCKNKFPVLKEVPKLAITQAKGGLADTPADELPTHLIIEGDNYHALSVLNYTHAGKVDVIYIDPPYNTGAKDWKYNNDYVVEEDGFRHSKWLSLMQKRLRLAKELLTESGAVICAIDENELHRLGLLLEQTFPAHELHCITIVHNPRGVIGKNFSYTHEYAFFSFPRNQKIVGDRLIADDQIKWRGLRDNGGESLREDARNCFYPIIVNNGDVVDFGDVVPNDEHPPTQTVKVGDDFHIYPIDSAGIERKWRYARQSVESIRHLLRAKKTGERYEISIGKDYGMVRTVWQDSNYDANQYGTKVVNTLVPGASFNFPKSVLNVRDCIAPIVRDNKKAIILDFFAGSGTTGHAVSLLNKQDRGERQFILCTNNENNNGDDDPANGIARGVCQPRIKAVLQGHKELPDLTGIPSNLRYFVTDFVEKSDSSDENKRRITEKCTEMLCLRENIFAEISAKTDYRIFQYSNRFLAVYYALTHDSLPKLKKELDALQGEKILYCFSLDPMGLNRNDFVGWDDVRLESIPQKILEVYEDLNAH